MMIWLNDFVELLRTIKNKPGSILRGRKFTLPVELRNCRAISEGLQIIRARWPESVCKDSKFTSMEPVFIFSAGWRSGSTLLQRLLISSGELAIWGEPLGEGGTIPRLAYSLASVTEDWPPPSDLDGRSELCNFANRWIANLCPHVSYLKKAHATFLYEWLGKPAMDYFKVDRWGFKEVRLTIDHARYLKWLFPKARFLFIYRSLFDAYFSWRRNGWPPFWPGYCCWSPVVFAKHWVHLLEGFMKDYSSVDGKLIKFEDLVSEQVDLTDLASYVGVRSFDRSILDIKIGSSDKTGKAQQRRLNPLDTAILSSIGKSLMLRAGYRADFS